MGGYVNLAIKKDGSIRKTLSYTGCIMRMANPLFYEGDEKAITEVFSLYGSCREVTDPAAGQIAPYGYGLIVIDFDRRVIFDMQNHANIDMVGIVPGDRRQSHLIEMARRGWLGDGLVDMLSGEPLEDGKFPSNRPFNDLNSLFQWCDEIMSRRWESRRNVSRGTNNELTLGNDTLPAFRFSPPGWRLEMFDKQEAAQMRQTLLTNGFCFSDADDAAWAKFVQCQQLKANGQL